MSWNETIDNYLYDEENEYTQADDLWDDFFVEKRDEIDERPWNQADALAHRNELNKQVGDMLEEYCRKKSANCCASTSALVVVGTPWTS